MEKPLAVIKGLNVKHVITLTLSMTARINSIEKKSGSLNGWLKDIRSDSWLESAGGESGRLNK